MFVQSWCSSRRVLAGAAPARRPRARISPVPVDVGVLCRAAPVSVTKQLRLFQLAWLTDVSTGLATTTRIYVPPVLVCRHC